MYYLAPRCGPSRSRVARPILRQVPAVAAALHELAQRVRVLDDRLLPRRGRAIQRGGWIGFEPGARHAIGAACIERHANARSVDRSRREARLTKLRIEWGDDVRRH